MLEYGLSSTDATRNSAGFSLRGQIHRLLLVEDQQVLVLRLAGGGVEILGRGHTPLLITLQTGLQRLVVRLGEQPGQVPIFADMKRIRSRSRSTIKRTATLCTRPADRRGRTLRHNSGETS